MITNYQALADSETAEIALQCIARGIEAAHPETVINNTVSFSDNQLIIQDSVIDVDDFDRIMIVGGGKATVPVAKSLVQLLEDTIEKGIVVSPTEETIENIIVHQGSHPTPSESGREGAEHILELVSTADCSTLVIAIITGGGSSLLPAPVGDISINEVTELTNELLASSATINEINTVRKHVSQIKGGRLAEAASPATVVGLLFSDVVGDDPSVIGSGPTAPDDTTFADALSVLERYDIQPPQSVQTYLQAGWNGQVNETPSTDDSVFTRVTNFVLANNWTAIAGAKQGAEEAGFDVCVLSSRIEGIAREIGKMHVAIAEEARETGHPASPPVVFLSVGETTVEVTGTGSGGPNLELVLSAGVSITREDIVIASVDTDGIDGNTECAGGIVTKTTLSSREAGVSALNSNDAYAVLAENNAVIRTGPTGTNVNDLRVMVVPDRGENSRPESD